MKRVLVTYRKRRNEKVREMIVRAENNVDIKTDSFADHCHDEIQDLIGMEPVWLRVDGFVELTKEKETDVHTLKSDFAVKMGFKNLPDALAKLGTYGFNQKFKTWNNKNNK